MKMKLTLVLSILSATRVGAQTPTFRGECRVTVVEYLCIEDVLGEQCDHTRLTCDDSEGVIHDVLGPSSEEIMKMVDAGIIQSTVSMFNPNDEEAVRFDGENVIIDMSNGFSLENLSITQDNYLTMSPKKGDNKMLLVLIDAIDYKVTYTASKLSSDVFGTNKDHTDTVNVSSQYKACSVNALRIFPGVEPSMTAPGTIRVDIDMNLNNRYSIDILNAAKIAAKEKLGFTLPGSYQNVYFVKNGCYTNGSGPGCGYAAYAGINSWYSMYPSRYITYSAIQGHEHGHNLGLYHSGEGSLAYDDHSCMMGNPLYSDAIGKMCFNPAKSWFLEWYPGSGELVFDKDTDSVMHKKLVGAGEWTNSNQGQVVIKIENGKQDLYVGFNRKAGANSQNKEFSDEVTVIEAVNTSSVSYQSYIKAHLKNGQEYTQDGVTVKVCDLDTNVVPGYVNIVIYDPSKHNGNCENGPTGSPTSLPGATWPNDFHWSSSGIPSGYDCVQITESADPHTWYDNYFCWRQGRKNPEIKWSSSGQLNNMRCTQILESADPNSWHDNYLCVPHSSSLHFSWSSAGSGNRICIKWHESDDPHSWNDNFLCAYIMCKDGSVDSDPGCVYDIVINEVADNGSSGTCDEKSWVELHNKGTINIDLIGMSLERDVYNSKKLTFGSTVMMAGEYLLICNPNPQVGSGPPGPPGFIRQILSDTEGKEVSNTGYFMHPFGDVTWSLLVDGTYADGAATPGSINRCQENPLDKFYLSIKQFRTCQWLSNLKNVWKKRIICKRKVDWMNNIGPAEVVCQETCKTCAICYQQNRSRFYYKTMIGRPKYSTCRKLKKKENKEAICKSIVFDETYGIPCALFACPQTCLKKTTPMVRSYVKGSCSPKLDHL